MRLRWRAGLTQREVAALLGLREGTVQRWEAGRGLPGAATLRALIALYLERGAFAAGHEEAAATACWDAARGESSRPHPPFDRAWFAALRGAPAAVGLPAPRHQDWGDAPDVAAFHGRAQELATLAGWVRDGHAQRLAVLGIGGVGKTALAARLARDLAPAFGYLYWRSLRNAPPVEEWLAGAIGLLSDQRAVPPAGAGARLTLLRELLRDRRTLLVLDNLETVLEPGVAWPRYRAGYEGYGQVLERLGERDHRATLLVTSRETPPEVTPSSGPRFAWQVLQLAGLGVAESRALLRPQALAGDEAAWGALVGRYRGNALALRLVGETIAEGFSGGIAAFLAAGGAAPADVGRLLEGQVGRLSGLERAVLLWLAVAREPVTFAELARGLAAEGRGAVLGAVEGLRGRSLLERGGQGATITLQPVVLEYATAQLVAAVGAEVGRGQPALLASHALVQATARDYVRRSQERLIAAPLLEALAGAPGGAGAVEGRLLALLGRWRDRPAAQGYGPGNVVNLLRLLRGELRGLDLSGLAIRQAYLQGVEAQDASLAGAHLVQCVLGEAFGAILSVALSGDGAYLAAGTMGGEVWVWRTADRTLLSHVQGQPGGVYGVALSADGGLLASGAGDGTVQLWAVESGVCLAILQGHTGVVRGMALSADGGLLASGAGDGTIRLWETDGGSCLAVLQGHADGVWDVALSSDGALLVSGGGDGAIRLWETSNGECLAVLQGHSGMVRGVALSADGGLLASGGGDGTVRLWRTESGACLAVLQGHAGGVYNVALSEDGGLLASGGVDGTVRLWRTESGACLAVLQGHAGLVRGMTLSGDGRVLASGGVDGTVRLWATESGDCLAVLQGHTGLARGVALSGDGRVLAGGGADGTIWLWETAGGTSLALLRGHAGLVYGVALSADGRLLASGGVDGTIRLWETGGGACLAVLRGHAGMVYSVSLSADGRLLASGGVDDTVRLWGAESGACLAVLEGHTGGVRGVALSGDGRLLASGGGDGIVRLWETGGGACLAVLQRHSGVVNSVALSAPGKLLASGGGDGTIRLWETAGDTSLTLLQGQVGVIWGVALSGDGRLLASGGGDGTVRLWETGGACLAVLRGHAGLVRDVALSADGLLVASGGVDGTVRLWGTQTGTCLHTQRPDRPYERLDISGVTGITAAQRAALVALGAVEQAGEPTGSEQARSGEAR